MADREWFVRHEIAAWFARRGGRAQAGHLARELGIDRRAAYDACAYLRDSGLLMRREDPRGRVWWAARRDLVASMATRKSRIVGALSRREVLPTSALCAAFGEHELRRGYKLLAYYRDQGLLASEPAQPGAEVTWRLHCPGPGDLGGIRSPESTR